MEVGGGHFKKKGPERIGGIREGNEGMNMVKLHYIHV